MHSVAVLGLLALQLALSVGAREKYVSLALATSNKTNRRSFHLPYHESDYFRSKSSLAIGAGPPPPPNPRPRPPLPAPSPPRPPPGIQPASDDLWDKSGAKGCTLGWGSKLLLRQRTSLTGLIFYSANHKPRGRSALRTYPRRRKECV
jgi:hypothetical protein